MTLIDLEVKLYFVITKVFFHSYTLKKDPRIFSIAIAKKHPIKKC